MKRILQSTLFTLRGMACTLTAAIICRWLDASFAVTMWVIMAVSLGIAVLGFVSRSRS